ncbi:MAG: ABC transporter substrate-binding protein [Alphaproteobacteria bacterium]
MKSSNKGTMLIVLLVLIALGGLAYVYFKPQMTEMAMTPAPAPTTAPATTPEPAATPSTTAAPTTEPATTAAAPTSSFPSGMPAPGQKLRIATEGAFPPFNEIGPDGQLKGFDVDIAMAICEEMQIECELVKQDWDGMIPGLLAKKYDAIVASMSITEERKQKIDFTDKYYQIPGRLAAKKDSGLTDTREGLAGKKIGVQRSTIHECYVKKYFPDSEIVLYGTQEEANLDLVAGRIDATLTDREALDSGLLKTPQGAGFDWLGGDRDDRECYGEGAGIAVRKEDSALRDNLSAAIALIRGNGKYNEVMKKYFDYDIYGSP